MIERGKYYSRRDGVVVGPAYPNDLRGKHAFPWLLSGIGYTNDGKFFASGKEDSHDLVGEFVETPMVPRPEIAADEAIVDAAVQRMAAEAGEPKVVIAPIAEAGDDPRDLKVADAYQVVGNLLSACGAFETAEGQRALDYFGISETFDPEFLPWPREALPDLPGEVEALREALRAANRKIAELTVTPWDLFAAHALGGFAAHIAGISRKHGEDYSEADARAAAARADALMAERSKRGLK